MKYVVTCAALLLPSVLATPAPLKKRVARDPIITNNIPIGDKVCDGNTYRPSDMRTAVNFASQAKKEWDKKGSKASYPYRNTPDQGKIQWSDFNLPGCSQGEDSTKADFQEFPIIPGGSVWRGCALGQGNDRIVCQDIDATTAAFYGIITHTTNDNGKPTGKFRLCDDPAGSAGVPPFAPGTCSLHITQWDIGERANPRYEIKVAMFDNAITNIGYQSRTGCDGSNSVSIPSVLEDDLVVTAESQHDYIQDTLGPQSWASNGNRCSFGD